MTAEDRALIGELLDEVRALRAELSRRRGGPADPAADGRLLVAIAHAAGGRVFGVADVLEHATVDADLCASLAALGLMNGRALGAALRRLRGHAAGGLVLQALGRDRGGVVWRVYVTDSHARGSASRGPHVG